MKKLMTVLIVLVLALGIITAGDVKFLFTELDQHPEILVGFLPTLTSVGASYEGLELMPGNLTQLQATIGGGYTQRRLYQDPGTGDQIDTDLFVYDSIQTRWRLTFLQGFGDSWVKDKDLITAYVGYEGRWESNIDSMKAGEFRQNGLPGASADADGLNPIPTFDSWSWGSFLDSTIYPDLANDRKVFGTILYGGIKLNCMEDRMVGVKGYQAKIDFRWAPNFLNKEISYYSAYANFVAGTTLFELSNKKGLNVLSFVAIDRVNVNWTDGTAVPVFAQGSVSLGRKMRGFGTWSYNTNFTVVNNFDIRIAGPEPFIDGIFPRINLFFDMGYHSGKYFNSDFSDSHFLCSTGAQFTVSFFDFIDLGYQLSYLIVGENYQQPGSKWISSFTFFLDF